MLSHIATDLRQVYLEEVFTPQLGKPGASTPAKPKSSSDIDGDGDVDSFEKKVRQLIYDVRHIMKAKKVPAEKAFQMRSSKTNYGAEVIKAAKEKLGIRGGSVTSVSEESSTRMVKVTINYKNGTIDRRNVPYGEISQLRSKPTISSVETSSNTVSYPGAGENYEKNYGKGGKNTVGDIDKDGTKEPDRHEYAGVKDTAIKKAKSKLRGYGVSEGFSNWREDLKEVVSSVSDEIASRGAKQIKENPKLDNYKDKIIVINPTFNEKNEILGGHIVESFELDEEYIDESINIATEFFYNCGLNENGVDIVIEELGEETFSEFIFNLSEEYFLSEELKKSESNVKTSKVPKGTKQYATTIARVKKQGGTKISAKDSVASTIQKDRVKKAVETAKETQASSSNTGKKPVRDAIARGIFGIAKAYQQGMERHRSATQTAGKALKVAGKGAKEFAGGVKSGVEATVDATKKIKKAVVGEAVYGGEPKKPKAPQDTRMVVTQADKTANTTAYQKFKSGDKRYRSADHLQEKAESQQQQKLFGLALSVKRGDTPRSEASTEVLKIVDTMSEKKIRDFAKTPHREVPKKKVTEAIANPEGADDRKSPRVTQRQQDTFDKYVKNKQKKYGSIGEDMTPTTPSQISAQKKVIEAQKLLAMANKNTLKKIPQQNTSNEVDKTTTSAKMSLENFVSFSSKTGKRTIEKGNPPVSNIEKKPGDYDYTHTPEQQAAMKKTPKTKIGSRFD